MRAYILYAHPDKRSFCRLVLEHFCRGLAETGHSFEVFDLYAERFRSEMTGEEYRREVGWQPDAPVPDDVRAEQEKIGRADALVFIYPVWWSDCPAKLKGWFDRVWTYGYAYFYDEHEARGTRITLPKALALCSAGHTVEHLEETGIAEAMRRIMLNDRLLGIGVKEARMVILGGMLPKVETTREANLAQAYDLGRTFF